MGDTSPKRNYLKRGCGVLQNNQKYPLKEDFASSDREVSETHKLLATVVSSHHVREPLTGYASKR